MTEPKYITAAGLRVRVGDATEPLTLDRLDELAALGAELRAKLEASMKDAAASCTIKLDVD